MKVATVKGQEKIQCGHEYREDVDTKFAPVNSNREEALKATNSVTKRLNKIGKLDEFKAQDGDVNTIDR